MGKPSYYRIIYRRLLQSRITSWKACLVTTLLFTVSTTLAFLLASPTLSDTSFVNRKRSDGNTVAAADLYGTGIRIGIYLQTLGLLLSVSRFHRTSGKGIKLIISANMIAILASWTILVRRQEVSPCEA